MKRLIWLLSLLLICPHARGQVYNQFSPGGALTGTWNSQTVHVDSGAFLVGIMPVANLATCPNTDILFSDGTHVQCSSTFQWNNSVGVLSLTGPSGGIIDSATNASLSLSAGNALTDVTPADIILGSGDGSNGGAVTIQGGPANGSGTGGGFSLSAGNGAGTNQGGGSFALSAGVSTGSATSGTFSVSTHGLTRLSVAENGAWSVSGAGPGSSGNFLQSAGSGSGPTWAAITLANLPTIANNTALANISGSTATPTAVNPLGLANMQAAVISAFAVSTTNITLSGLQTIDGQSVGTGQTVLVAHQTTTSQDGIYISASGAWTRAANFPAGYVIQSNCDLYVFISHGTANQGHTYFLSTGGSPITIGTSGQSWGDATVGNATFTVAGLIKISAAGVASAVNLPPITVADCMSYADLNGSNGDQGNAAGTPGQCVTSDPNGHPQLQGNGTPPTVTGTGCSLGAGTNTDNSGAIVATGIDTCTLTFGSAYTVAPRCAIANIGATVLANATSLPTTAHAIFATTAAGTFMYTCL